jgi:hypothetical protein
MTGTPTAAPRVAPEPEEDEASYGTRVEDAFIAERGTPFLLSPKDWGLVCAWRAAGIPSGTVIRAVQGAFERKRARGDLSKISSLTYCANAVEVLWALERRGLAGSHGPRAAPLPEPLDAPRRLRLLAASLGPEEGAAPEVAEAVTAAREAIGALDAASGFEALEEALSRIEKSLLKRLEKTLGDEGRERLAREAAEEAGDVSALPKEAQRRILSAIRGRALRRLHGLAPLTLLGE